MRVSLQKLVSAFAPLREYVGPLSAEMLSALVARDLSDESALEPGYVRETWVGEWRHRSRVRPLTPLLHIASGNSPHGIAQSLLRGLLLGGRQMVKLPSAGLPVIEAWHAGLPEELAQDIELSRHLPDEWLDEARAVVVYGSDETVVAIRERLRPDQRLIAHGHKISIGLATECTVEIAERAAHDVGAYLQQGCQSLIHIYVPERKVLEFAGMLATAMEQYERAEPRGLVPLSVDGAIANLRETVRYHAASLPGWGLWESRGNTTWTVVATPQSEIERCPLYRVAFVKPLPASLDEASLGPESRHISTIAVGGAGAAEHPIAVPYTRMCSLGETQEPTLLWHADGYAPLGSLVEWVDCI